MIRCLFYGLVCIYSPLGAPFLGPKSKMTITDEKAVSCTLYSFIKKMTGSTTSEDYLDIA
jgi:hypothetical protein